MEFIPLIEQTALVRPLTLYVIEAALRQLAVWREAGLRLGMSLNLSVRNLLDPKLPGQIEALLKRHGAQAGELTVEVTESAAMADPVSPLRALTALRELGVGVAIDYFGTGHASIAYLAELPVDEIKIDRSFIDTMCDDERNAAIVGSTIELARHLDLDIVAEGIETQEVWDRVLALGCTTGQGFFISRPVPGEQLAIWLRARSQHAALAHSRA